MGISIDVKLGDTPVLHLNVKDTNNVLVDTPALPTVTIFHSNDGTTTVEAVAETDMVKVLFTTGQYMYKFALPPTNNGVQYKAIYKGIDADGKVFTDFDIINVESITSGGSLEPDTDFGNTGNSC